MANLNRKATLILSILLLLCALPVVSLADRDVSEHPILEPLEISSYTQTKDRFVNVLLLGVDYGFDGYWGSHSKKVLENCHTDAFLVFSINMTTGEVNMISVPRDSATYVPGVRGLYKLNGAFNCGNTLEEGFESARRAACWHLGGVKIDYYACVDMSAMVTLGDAMGGVDMDVEMHYISNGRTYDKGYQHLDGQGMMDYARARKNATTNANDIVRTGRQRQVVEAIFLKLKSNPGLIKTVWNKANDGKTNFFTDLKLGTVLNLLNKVKNADKVGNYVLTGSYRRAANWNFTITDQENRKQVLKTVFGIDAEENNFVSQQYIQYLENEGFNYVHSINMAKKIFAFADAMTLTAEQQKAMDSFESAYNKLVKTFDAVSKDKSTANQQAVKEAWQTLQGTGNKAAEKIGYSLTSLRWYKESAWNNDPLINEFQLDWA